MAFHYTDLTDELDAHQTSEAASHVLSGRISLKKTAAKGLYRTVFKRALDITLVLLSLPLVLPLILVLAVLVSRDGGPALYTQKRVGKNGRIFTFWKLRSMVPDADAELETYLAENPQARQEWNVDQKLKNDPRITRFGRLLRKSSMDELPQLWNVLIGDMSLVGPRPMMPDQRPLYKGRDYFALLPGITGFWQISDRNECSFSERAGFDTRYNHALSFKTDLVVLMRTLRVVARGTGH